MTRLSNISISISTSPFCASPVLLHLHEASHGTLATEFGDATEAETQKENANGSTWCLSKTGSDMVKKGGSKNRVWYGLMCLCVYFCSCFIFQCVERRNSLISMILYNKPHSSQKEDVDLRPFVGGVNLTTHTNVICLGTKGGSVGGAKCVKAMTRASYTNANSPCSNVREFCLVR